MHAFKGAILWENTIERVLIIALDQCWWTNSDLDCSICCSIRKKSKSQYLRFH